MALFKKKKEIQIDCPNCEEKFTTKEAYDKHYAEKHPAEEVNIRQTPQEHKDEGMTLQEGMAKGMEAEYIYKLQILGLLTQIDERLKALEEMAKNGTN